MSEKQNNGLLWAIGGTLIILGVVYFSLGGGVGQPLKVGAITPLSGDAATYGVAIQRAYDLAAEEMNAAGGVDGRPVELVYEDGDCRNAAATIAAQKLVSEDGVKFILGGTCSGETLAAAAVTQEARVLLLSPTSTSPAITQAGDLVFNTYPSIATEVQMIADYATQHGQARAAVVSENTDFAQGVREAFKASYTGALVFDGVIQDGEADFRSFVTRMRAANPQMVYVVVQSPSIGEVILAQMEELGMNVGVYAANTMLNRAAFVANPNLYEEVVFAEATLQGEKTADMLTAYEAKYGQAPEYLAFTAAAYDNVYLLAEAIGEVGEDARAVAGYLSYQVSDWPGAIGMIDFDENGDASLPLELVQVIGGVLVPLEE